MSQLKTLVRAPHRLVLRVLRGPVRALLRPFRPQIKALRRRLPTRVDLYIRRLGGAPALVIRPTIVVPPELVAQARASRPPVPETPTRLYVAPANFAGQGWLWARAAERQLPGVGAVNMVGIPSGFRFYSDHQVPEQVYLHSSEWQREQFEYVRRGFTHVLIEAQRPMFGSLLSSNAFTEARALTGYGLQVATIGHGRDVRLPSLHRENYPWSPYVREEWAEVDVLERQVRRNLAGLASLDLPAFVSTPDLLDDLPDATWCPVVIDLALWESAELPMERPRPVAVHMPTSSKFKGSEQVDEAMLDLHERGLVEYRRIEGVSPEEVRRIIGSADLVLDQFRLGSYGVTACEAMAAGRVVLGHITEHNRRRVHEAAGEELPIVETTVENISEVVLELLDDRGHAQKIAAQGPDFVRRLHDGSYSATVLSSFLAAS
ncbi:glycosyltransferase family 4 protein [Streptomyces sp. SID13031]|uniref:glycosyltransferase family 4 protein n=1 Tax=Streptomyces sp. SID13031 TaxID=2706046 RepID=UPI0013C5FAAB|nr:glycosyltransferase family 4 protein [Streptomyces sp. SID13031]NEA35467.1 glycosyltransferase family 4 protein [Streptomyces sp. SID13031]